MALTLDSDVINGDSHLFVEFTTQTSGRYEGQTFIKIMTPGDQTNIIDRPMQEHDKVRFVRQWLHFQMQANPDGVGALGVPLLTWNQECPEECNASQLEELHILKFRVVEDLARASDAQLQRVGMGGTGLRERAQQYLLRRTTSADAKAIAETKSEVEALKAQIAELLSEKRASGRPRKET